MTTYPNLNNKPELLKIKFKNDEVKDLKKNGKTWFWKHTKIS